MLKTRGVWARVGQVLRQENVEPRVAAKFYKVVVQAVLLYGSETWNLAKAALARLEGFNIRAAYKMAKRQCPRRRPMESGNTPDPRMFLKNVASVPSQNISGRGGIQ